MPKDKNSLKGFVDLSNTSQHAADSVMNKYFVGFPYSLPSQNEEHVSGIEDITDWVRNGYSPLYSRDGMPGYSFFTDGSGKVYRVSDAENINTSGMSPLSYNEMRKMLPRREYIGGKDYRFKTAQRIPGFLDKIKERSEAYGVDPNLVLNRILHEGWIDQQVLNYNGLDASQQGDYWNGLWDAPVSGYGSFGLDYAGNNLMNGVYELKDTDASWRSAEFTDYEGGNNFRTGTSLEADNLSSAIEILAAELAYRQGEVAKKYGKKGSDLNVWTNAAFNMGLNNDDFKNEDWVRNQYTYPDYYGQIETQKKLGGVIERFGADKLRQYFASGGSIHIKPSHRGRLTELKERTDKTEEELYNDGNPAHKKMVVFARNARKWKHEDGGLLRRFDMGGDKDNDALAKAIIARVNQEEAAKARAEGAPMIGEKPLENEDYLLGLAAIGANAPIAGTVSAVKEVAPLWGRAGLRMLKDLPAFEFVDRLPTMFGGKRMTELGGDATQAAYEGITDNHNLSDMSRALVRMPGEFIAGVVPGVAGDMLMRTGSNAVLRSLNNRGIRIDGSMDYLEPLAHETNVVQEMPKPVTAKMPIVSAVDANAYEIADLGGGYMLKSLMRGNPLEKQISKNGTVNVNNVRALIGKGSKVEQAVVDKVLASEEFAGKKAIDYNKFRKAVQDELITYERVPNEVYAEYGMDRIGQKPQLSQWSSDWATANNFIVAHPELDYAVDDAGNIFAAREVPGLGKIYDEPVPWEEISQRYPGWKQKYAMRSATPETFTFESPRIPNGSAKHYGPNTLGHSRTYTTADEPDVLHVMESQSDWGQSAIKIDKNNDIEYLRRLLSDKKSGFERNKHFFSPAIKNQYFSDIQELEDHISRLEKIGDAKAQASYLHDNYTSRQIQENLRYAAEKGQTKMRYPTRETAAKIEGYNKAVDQTALDEISINEERELFKLKKDTGYDDWYDEMRGLYDAYQNGSLSERDMLRLDYLLKKDNEYLAERNKISQKAKKRKQELFQNSGYSMQDETILKKYDAFPKQYQKLFKGADVRTVTDAKGNTWYEVDVPENYLQQEWAYADGGNLNRLAHGGLIERYGKDKILSAIAKMKQPK